MSKYNKAGVLSVIPLPEKLLTKEKWSRVGALRCQSPCLNQTFASSRHHIRDELVVSPLCYSLYFL